MKKILLICILLFEINTLLLAQISIPYYNNFETDTIGWYSDTSYGDSFHWDSTNYVGCSGSRGLGVGIDTSGTYTALYSPLFDFTNVSYASLCLTHKYDATLYQDGVRIDYSYNNSFWVILGGPSQGTNWYNAPTIMATGLPAWSGTSTNCINSSIALYNSSGSSIIQFRFMPVSMASNIDEYFLDDFRICISPCACDSIVSIEELEPESDYAIYPNPAVNSFTIESKNFGNSEFSIYNSTGQQVFKGELSKAKTIPSNYFIPGIYFVKILDSRKCTVKKVVITSH